MLGCLSTKECKAENRKQAWLGGWEAPTGRECPPVLYALVQASSCPAPSELNHIAHWRMVAGGTRAAQQGPA